MRDDFFSVHFVGTATVISTIVVGGIPVAARLHERGVGIVGVAVGGLLGGLLLLGALLLLFSFIIGYFFDPALLKTVGWWFVVIGILIAVFSRTVVFPGLEWFLGVERIVGSENVSYLPDGSSHYTNPRAVARWIASVTGVGISMAAFGVVCLLSAWWKLRQIPMRE